MVTAVVAGEAETGTDSQGLATGSLTVTALRPMCEDSAPSLLDRSDVAPSAVDDPVTPGAEQ